jgi:hypothetical protein
VTDNFSTCNGEFINDLTKPLSGVCFRYPSHAHLGAATMKPLAEMTDEQLWHNQDLESYLELHQRYATLLAKFLTRWHGLSIGQAMGVVSCLFDDVIRTAGACVRPIDPDFDRLRPALFACALATSRSLAA